MEHERSERQTPIQFRCKKMLPSVEKTDDPNPVATEIAKVDEKEDPGYSLASPTPQKPEWRSKAKGVNSYDRKEKHLPVDIKSEDVIIQSEVVNPENTSDRDSSVLEFSKPGSLALSRSLKDEQIELPDKYKTLANLFNRMESSIRLLGLTKKLPTFQNICTQVEVLTKRKFSCSHLAQMKYVFPEAILIEKILIHDEKSLCMKPDMKITLVLDAVECPLHPDQSASMALCQAFHARLLEFLNTQPEDADVPESMLPEPFNRRNHVVLHNTLLEGPSVEVPPQASLDSLLLSSASHFSSSFHRQFSQKVTVPETQLTELLASPASLVSISSNSEGKEFRKSPLRKENLCSVSAIKSPAEVIYTTSRGMISQFSECTPVKYDSNTDVLMTETPALQTPKRAIPTPHKVIEDEKSLCEPKSTPSARRSLIYSPSKTDGSVSDPAVCTIEQSKAIQYSCQRTAATKSMLGEEIGGSATNQLQVSGDIAAGDRLMSQFARGKRQELLACLAKMFDTVCLISRSIGCSLITKQELVHKIISNNLEIEETREVEEQLGLLEELAPDWICKKALSTGDFIYCIKGTSDPESIRARLVEAV